MRVLLLALIALLMLSSIFDWDPGPAPGLKLKNAILYLLALGLTLRFSLDRRFKVELPWIHVVFAVLVGYSILSYLAVVLVVDYPYYGVLSNALLLKNVVDQMLFFLVFFYGLRSEAEAIPVLKYLLAVFALSHVASVLDAQGAISFGDIEQREDGRVQGLLGESNQYGAFVAMTLPALISAAAITRGVQRLAWVLAVFITGMTLIMTVSRGAYVAVFVAGACALIMFRRYAPPGRLLAAAVATMFAAILVAAIAFALGFGELVYQRVIAGSSGDLGSTSSGRTEIWANVLEVMIEQPISFLTGFGWRAYWSMPFRFSPHNYYLNQWFNLGLTGLTCSILLFVLPIRTARTAIKRASAVTRSVLIGFIVATIAFAVATFFVDLSQPWLYFWAYAGVAMRLAVCAETHPAALSSVSVDGAAPSADPFGWAGALRR
ncbi:MAG: O-antigen ligase family protein [Steroidobacter sp.]